MKPDESADPDLRSRFAEWRRCETAAAPDFGTILAAAQGEARRRRVVRSRTMATAALATAAAVALLLVAPAFRRDASPAGLARIPVLLPPDPESPGLFADPLIAGTRVPLPTDALIPLHLRIRL